MKSYYKALMVMVIIAIASVAFYLQTKELVSLAGGEGNDDAYISFRYSKNLVEGHGLVYNPGEERVEGYSNFLYTLLIAGGIALGGVQWTYQYALWINLLAGVLLLILIGRSRYLGLTTKIGAIFLTGITPALAFWAASGLETVPVVMVQVGIVLLVEEICRRGVQKKTVIMLGALCAVSIFLRADGFLIPLLAVLYLAVNRQKVGIGIGAATAVAMFGQFGWRLWYYGDLMPNTYYAKVSGTLAERLGSAQHVMSIIFWQTGIFVALIVLATGAGWHLWKKGGWAQKIPFRFWFFGAWLGYWIYVGGDIYHERFLVVLFPLAWITLCQAIRWGLNNSPKPKLILQIGVIAGMLLVVVVTPRWITYEKQAETNSVGWRFVGEILKLSPEDSSVAVDAAGKIAFFSGLKTIDMHGLNDKHIGRLPVRDGEFVLGHAKTDWDYVMSQQPTFITSWMKVSEFGDFNSDQITIAGKSLTRYEECGYKLHKLANATRLKTLPPPTTQEEWEIAMLSSCDYAILRFEGEPVRVAAAK